MLKDELHTKLMNQGYQSIIIIIISLIFFWSGFDFKKQGVKCGDDDSIAFLRVMM